MSGEGDHPIETPEEEVESSYRPPPEKTIEEILEADKEDESLRKYKETLLGEAKERKIIVDESDKRKVIVKRLALVVTDRPDVELDLTGDLTDLKKQIGRFESDLLANRNRCAVGVRKSILYSTTTSCVHFREGNITSGSGKENALSYYHGAAVAVCQKVFIIKEGVSYRIRIDFIVQREIVHGLKYVQKTYRLGVPVDKMTHMVGSYPPKLELQSYTTPPEDAPSGMMSRGTYTVHSLFTDDDKNTHLKWEWCFEIKKDWKD